MKKAIVIGASSGIGRELVKILYKNGYKVGATGRREVLLNELKSIDPDMIMVKSFDLTDTKSSSEKLLELIEELGGLDLLIFSAGTGHINKSLDYNIEKTIIDLNIIGFTNIIVKVFSFFKSQGYGHIAIISSIGGLLGNGDAPAYNATKAFQINYMKGLKQKVKKSNKNIYITDIRPGLVDTDMAKGEGLFWVMPVDKTAKQIYTAIKKKKKFVYVTKRWGIIARVLYVFQYFQ